MNKKIYFNGNIITVDKKNFIAEGIVVEDGLIKLIGSNDLVLKEKENAKLIDLKGKTILPGIHRSSWTYCSSFSIINVT